MPSFYWGRPHYPDLMEYYSRRGYYDFLYWLPYVLAGLIMTIAGCLAAPRLHRRFGGPSSHAFVGTGAATLALLVLVALASDVGGLLGFWDGPLFFLRRDIGVYDVFTLAKVFLPASFLAGVAAVGRQRLNS